jgi:crossover junction endodeoxyribonuclease RuvC
MVRIMGIDPGFDRLGVAIIESDNGKDTLIYSTCITTSKKDSFEERLLHVGKTLTEIVHTHAPEELAIESLFFTNNQKTVITVAEVRGICIYIASLSRIKLFEYSPPQIKIAITGYGRATKDDIAFMVPKILKTGDLSELLDDEVDAIAIALTHSASRKNVLINKTF